jgi:hypothetical protein
VPRDDRDPDADRRDFDVRDEPGRVHVPILTGRATGKGWTFGGLLGALIRLLTGRKE